MRNYGSTAGTRAYEQQLVARAYPSPVQYRRVLTPYEQQKAEAGQLFYGSTPQDLAKHPVVGIATLVLAFEVLERYRGRSFIQDTLVPTAKQLVGSITGRF